MKRFYTNMPLSELIDWLRYSAIAGGMPQQFIDRVDELADMADQAAQVEELADELTDAKEDRDDLLEELRDLVKAVQAHSDIDPSSMSENLRAGLEWANKALERHESRRPR
jgi:hypothetical protein